MHKTVDATVEADEDPEIRDGLDGPGDLVALAEAGGKLLPRVHLGLLDAQGDAAAIFVDVEDHYLHVITHLHDLRGMDVLVGPVHLGNVHKAFHALFDLHEATVVREVRDLPFHNVVFRVAGFDLLPGIFPKLLEAQGYALTIPVKFENADADFIANIDDFARVLDTTPSHIGDVKQAVDAAEIHESTVIREVLDDSLEVHTLGEGGQQRFPFDGILFLEHGATRHHHIVAALVELDDLEFKFLALKVGHFAHGAHVHQGAGEEGPDAVDVDGKTALNLALEEAWNLLSTFEGLFQHHPHFGATGLLPGQGVSKATSTASMATLTWSPMDSSKFPSSTNWDRGLPRPQARVAVTHLIDVDNGPRDNGTGLHFDGL